MCELCEVSSYTPETLRKTKNLLTRQPIIFYRPWTLQLQTYSQPITASKRLAKPKSSCKLKQLTWFTRNARWTYELLLWPSGFTDGFHSNPSISSGFWRPRATVTIRLLRLISPSTFLEIWPRRFTLGTYGTSRQIWAVGKWWVLGVWFRPKSRPFEVLICHWWGPSTLYCSEISFFCWRFFNADYFMKFCFLYFYLFFWNKFTLFPFHLVSA